MSHPGAPLRPGCARGSRNHFATDSVRSKLLPLHVPASPLRISREASRDLWRSIGPSTMVVFKLRTSLSVRKYNDRFNLHDIVQGKTTFISPTYFIDETAKTGVSDERGRQQSFTQAAPSELKLGYRGGKVKRARHRPGGVRE